MRIKPTQFQPKEKSSNQKKSEETKGRRIVSWWRVTLGKADSRHSAAEVGAVGGVDDWCPSQTQFLRDPLVGWLCSNHLHDNPTGVSC